jgi:hypothetical protein
MARSDLADWEQSLKLLFDEIDDRLEDTFGPLFSLHPSRPKRGVTSNKEQDGLFNVGASFSAGFGSHYGRGYVVDIDVVTLESVPQSIRTSIENEVYELILGRLETYFPGRDLTVGRDGNVMKIHGDLTFRRDK